MRFKVFAVLLACCALAAPLAFAQTTGEISGVVVDGSGAPLPGATVTITGPQMPNGRSSTTLADGAFRFRDLPPGKYHLKAELSGMGVFDQDVVVALVTTTEVRPVLRATARESVEVTAALPLVDTKASEITVVTPKETIEKLPLTRTFTGTFQLAPGVAENNSSAPNAGGGKQDNTFFYDGVNITNPFFGDLYQNFSELDIQEVAITRAGVTPEYGRTGGFIVNGVTKSGSNNIHAEARFEYQPAGLAATSKDPTLTSQFEVFRPGLDIGGPIIRDHLFGYGSVNFLRQTEQDRVNNLGAVPDNATHINEYFGKLTGNPTPNHLLNASFRYRGISADNADIFATYAPSAGDIPKTIDRVIVASWFATFGSKFSMEARFNHNENNNGVSPITPIPYQTPFNPAAPYLSGLFTTTRVSRTGQTFIFPPATTTGQQIGGVDIAQNDQNFFRDEYRLQGSYLTNWLGATHDIRAGFTFSRNREDLRRSANGWGSITVVDTATTGTCSPTGNPDGGRPCYRARYWQSDEQISRGQTYGIFIQDQATWKRLTVNLGVLVNEDYYIPNDDGAFSFIRGDFHTPGNAAAIPSCLVNSSGPACTYKSRIDLPWSKQWQPRVGLAYEINPNVHDKVYGNYARYDNMDNQSLARAAAPVRLLRVDAFFNITTGKLIQQVVRNNQTNKLVIPNIDPTYTDEGILGYARPLGGGWAVELWGMYRKSTDIIEDFTANPVYGDPITGAGAN
ncbi:MAG TPA: TonB-dependent receptor, partial [Thermoanaerobaculia bacterium]|nr:TonB-dependent receptor [Thermoanaerobaculia bacterium]